MAKKYQRKTIPRLETTLQGLRAMKAANSVRNRNVIRNEESRDLVNARVSEIRRLNATVDDVTGRVFVPDYHNPDAGPYIVL